MLRIQSQVQQGTDSRARQFIQKSGCQSQEKCVYKAKALPTGHPQSQVTHRQGEPEQEQVPAGQGTAPPVRPQPSLTPSLPGIAALGKTSRQGQRCVELKSLTAGPSWNRNANTWQGGFLWGLGVSGRWYRPSSSHTDSFAQCTMHHGEGSDFVLHLNNYTWK